MFVRCAFSEAFAGPSSLLLLAQKNQIYQSVLISNLIRPPLLVYIKMQS